MTLTLAILGFITLQRLGELALASCNTRRLKARGAVETGARHYPMIVALHAAWLTGLWFAAWDRPPNPWLLALFVAVEALRAWTLISLGDRWTTRIITLPGEPLVRRGPYRFLPHPNYLVVVMEIWIAPLMFGLVTYAVCFSILNALVLWLRIRVEEQALSRAG